MAAPSTPPATIDGESLYKNICGLFTIAVNVYQWPVGQGESDQACELVIMGYRQLQEQALSALLDLLSEKKSGGPAKLRAVLSAANGPECTKLRQRLNTHLGEQLDDSGDSDYLARFMAPAIINILSRQLYGWKRCRTGGYTQFDSTFDLAAHMSELSIVFIKICTAFGFTPGDIRTVAEKLIVGGYWAAPAKGMNPGNPVTNELMYVTYFHESPQWGLLFPLMLWACTAINVTL